MNDIFKQIIVSILTWEARLVLARYRPRIIAVTGSVGKTTTKDAIFSTLSSHVYVRKSDKSMNSDIGVPLTILGLNNAWRNPLKWLWNIVQGLSLALIPRAYPHWLVLELGADRPGDIRTLAKWLRPDIAVFTGVPEVPVHVEYFGSPEDVVREKRSLAEYLRPSGKIVVNGDDARMSTMQSDFRGAFISFGFEKFTDYRATHDAILYEEHKPMGMEFRLEHAGSSIPVQLLGALGRPRIYAALAALAVAEIVGIDSVFATRALSQWAPPPGRMRIIAGLKGSLIIDDTYNSSPAAALSALETLKDIKYAKRKIAVMGDMLELGRYSAAAHKQIGEAAAKSADMLITVGFRARVMGEAAYDAGMPEAAVREYEQNESHRAGKELEFELQQNDVVLVKGSQSMRMERVVEEVMANPERASELLVRQESEWLAKE